MMNRVLDMPMRIRRRLNGEKPDYREYLFNELAVRLNGVSPSRILEIGPKDGVDSERLLALNPAALVLVDLPDKKDSVEGWLPSLHSDVVEFVVGNIMYDASINNLPPFDVVWCTGVLYHNPEQLRMIRRLFDFLKPGGVLVIESATARRRATRNENCVEIWHNIDKPKRRAHHVSVNISHLPSRSAIRSWMEMVGFEAIELSSCHRSIGRALAADRAAFLAARPSSGQVGAYYTHAALAYDIGKAV